MKRTLQKVLPPHLLTFEKIATVTSEVEAILNSLPLISQDSHTQDGSSVITAGHFLVSRPLKARPVPPADDQLMPLRKRWKLVSHLVQKIWKQWRVLYLQSLNNFPKWRTSRPNLRVGNVVVVKDHTFFQQSWPLAVVINVLPGADGVV